MCKDCGIYVTDVSGLFCTCNMRCVPVVEYILKICIDKFFYYKKTNDCSNNVITFYYEPIKDIHKRTIHYNCLFGILIDRYTIFKHVYEHKFKNIENYKEIEKRIFKPEKEILEKYLDCTHFGLFYNKNNKFFDYYIINHFNIEFNMNINCIDCGWIFYETYKQHITYIDFKIILDTKTIIKSQTILEDYQIYLFLEKTIKNHNLISEYESYLKIEFEKISKTIPYNENCLKFFDEKINELEGLYTTKTSHLSKLYTERSRYYDIVSNLIVDEEKKKIEIHKKLVEYKKNRKKMKEDSFFL